MTRSIAPSSRCLYDPIALPGGRALITLEDVAIYIQKMPSSIACRTGERRQASDAAAKARRHD